MGTHSFSKVVGLEGEGPPKPFLSPSPPPRARDLPDAHPLRLLPLLHLFTSVFCCPHPQDAVASIKWATDPSGKFKGFGVVEFKSPAIAKKASTMSPPQVGVTDERVCVCAWTQTCF